MAINTPYLTDIFIIINYIFINPLKLFLNPYYD